MATTESRKARRKFKLERRVGRTVVNPLVAALDKIGIRASSVVDSKPPAPSPASRGGCRSPVVPTTAASG